MKFFSLKPYPKPTLVDTLRKRRRSENHVEGTRQTNLVTSEEKVRAFIKNVLGTKMGVATVY